MNNQKNNSRLEAERRMLPFFIEFVKFSTAFVAIVTAALITLNIATAI